MEATLKWDTCEQDEWWELFHQGHIEDKEICTLFERAGLPEDAAAFMAKWYPEYVECAISNITGYSFSIEVVTEEELVGLLDGMSEEEWQNEDYGSIFRDGAFEGVCIIYW